MQIYDINKSLFHYQIERGHTYHLKTKQIDYVRITRITNNGVTSR